MMLRSIHRIVAILIVLVTLYLGVTGTLIEAVDLRTLMTDPQPFDPDLMAMREDFEGPPNFRVLKTSDHLAGTIPDQADYAALLERVAKAARAENPGLPLRYAELRVAEGRVIGQVKIGERELRYDALTAAPLGAPPQGLDGPRHPPSLRNTIKSLHRMTSFGNWALWINVVTAAGLILLIVTGVILYVRIYRVRLRIKRPNPFWSVGGTWRALHRSISIACALFLTIVVLSGAWLAYESLIYGMYNAAHRPAQPMAERSSGKSRGPATGNYADVSSPLRDEELAPMLRTTLGTYHRIMPDLAIRAVRLRYFAGMPQGVVITDGYRAQQIDIDTATGRRVSRTEASYPETGFPFGWEAHQIAKGVHRGDYFGVGARAMSIIAGVAMIYLSVSGIALYAAMWRKRRESGRKAFFWKG